MRSKGGPKGGAFVLVPFNGHLHSPRSMSDHEIWRDSTTSAEDWGDDGDDGEWPVKGIIGEEVNTAGEIK